MPIDFQDLSLPDESSAVTAGELPPGEASSTVILAVAPGQRIELDADPALSQVSRIADDLVSFPTGAELILENFTVAAAAPPVLILPDGSEIAGEALVTAAGSAPTGGGGSQYRDNLGNVIDLLNARGVIDPTELAFGVPDPDLDGGFLGNDGGDGSGETTLGAGPVIIDDESGNSEDNINSPDSPPGQSNDGDGNGNGNGNASTNGGGNQSANAGAGNGGESGDSETGDVDIDPGNSGDNNNSPGTPPGQSQGEGTVYIFSDLDEAGGTIQGFDADTDIIHISALLSDVDADDRGDRVDITFEQGRDATVNLDSDGDGSFETLLVTLDNYRGDLGLDDIQVDSGLA